MKNLLSLGVVLFIAMTAMTLSGGQDRGGKEGIKDRFVGAWRLVSLEARSQSHHGRRSDCSESAGTTAISPSTSARKWRNEG